MIEDSLTIVEITDSLMEKRDNSIITMAKEDHTTIMAKEDHTVIIKEIVQHTKLINI